MRWTLALLPCLCLAACGGDALKGEYDAFEGTWYWTETATKEQGIFNNDRDSISPAMTGYEVRLEMTDDGKVKFFKDNDLLTENQYTVADKESISGRLTMIIKMKGGIGGLNLDDKRLKLDLFNDQLEVDRFPFHAIDDASSYHTDHNSLGNYFERSP